MTALDPERVRAEFPQLQAAPGGSAPIYLDSACTTLRPESVIRAMAEHQRAVPGCHGRSGHRFGREASAAYAQARRAVRDFVGAERDDEIIFVRNTTEAINLVARSLGLRAGGSVLTTGLEHNSNLLPWQRLRAFGVAHRVLRVDVARGLDPEALRRELRTPPDLVAVAHVSNLCGLELPVADICAQARRAGALSLVDAAQSVATRALDVRALGCDFLAFSFHKMFGPTGIGALYARAQARDRLAPWLVGGDTAQDVRYDGWEPAAPPERFEAGVANTDGAAGAKAAIEWLAALGPARLHAHAVSLNRLATAELARHARVRIIGPPEPERRGAILNFHVDGLEAAALAALLDARGGIMVRHGRHCAHAWYHAEGVPESVRASFGPYNTEAEVELFARTVSQVVRMLG